MNVALKWPCVYLATLSVAGYLLRAVSSDTDKVSDRIVNGLPFISGKPLTLEARNAYP